MKKIVTTFAVTTIVALSMMSNSVGATTLTTQNNKNELQQAVKVPIADAKAQAAHVGLNPDKIVGGYFVSTGNSSKTQGSIVANPSFWGDKYLSNVQEYDQLGAQIKRDIVTGPSPLYKMTVTSSLAFTKGGSVDLTADFLKTNLSLSTTSSVTLTSEYPVAIPAGHTYRIYAYQDFNHYQYDVYSVALFGSDNYLGTSWCNEPKGIFFFQEEV